MNTVVTIPPGWLTLDDGALTPPSGPLRVELGAPQPAPLDPVAFVRELLAGAQLLSSTAAVTTCGWAYDRLEVMVADPVEGRIIAVYRFLACVAVITIRARSSATLTIARSDLEALLASARPDWRGEQVAALADLWA